MSPFYKKYQIYISTNLPIFGVYRCIFRSRVRSFYSYIVYTGWLKINGSNLNITNFKVFFYREILREIIYTLTHYYLSRYLERDWYQNGEKVLLKFISPVLRHCVHFFVAAIERRSFATSTEHQSGKFDGSRTPSSRRVPPCAASHRPNHIGCS